MSRPSLHRHAEGAISCSSPSAHIRSRRAEPNEHDARRRRVPRATCRRLRQCWYSAAAAKNISEETRDEGEGGTDLEGEGEAALALERRLHARPPIQFVNDSRQGGFNKVRVGRSCCGGWGGKRAGRDMPSVGAWVSRWKLRYKVVFDRGDLRVVMACVCRHQHTSRTGEVNAHQHHCRAKKGIKR